MAGIYAIKPWFVRRLRPIEDACVARGVSADALTIAAIGVGVLTGAALVAGTVLPAVWFAVPFLVLTRLALNALDGAVARRTRPTRPAGAVLNEVGDRLADIASIGALAFVAGPALGMGALAATLLASLSAVLSFALTGARDNSGPMGKADRQVILAVLAPVAAVVGPIALSIGAVLILLGATVTAGARVARLTRALRVANGPTVAQIFRTDVVEFEPEGRIDVLAG